jgi:flagellar assembly factor FliW
VKILSARFGELDIEAQKIIRMPDGIIGFPERSFTILTPADQGPFCWLQSVDNPAIAFVVVDPALFFAGYDVKLTREEHERLALVEGGDMVILTIVTMAPTPARITANLQGPIIINPEAMLAKQVVLEDSRYSTKQPLFPDLACTGSVRPRSVPPAMPKAGPASTRIQTALCA